MTTDASDVALGAVLSQGTIGNDKPICYASRTLTKTEQKYTTSEKELLALVWATKYFRPYIFGRRFKMVTDHQPLTWLMSHNDHSSKLTRWRLRLEEFDYEIVYKKGSLNTNGDALSRINPTTRNYEKNETVQDIIDFYKINPLPDKFCFKEWNESLLNSGDNFAHCISSDLEMSNGIASDIRKLIKNHENLKSKQNEIGDILTSDFGERKIFLTLFSILIFNNIYNLLCIFYIT